MNVEIVIVHSAGCYLLGFKDVMLAEEEEEWGAEGHKNPWEMFVSGFWDYKLSTETIW